VSIGTLMSGADCYAPLQALAEAPEPVGPASIPNPFPSPAVTILTGTFVSGLSYMP
jgi:hypothetical protein